MTLRNLAALLWADLKTGAVIFAAAALYPFLACLGGK